MCGQHTLFQIHKKGRDWLMNSNILIETILSGYDKHKLNKLQDFLLSEIDEDTKEETIGFIKSSDKEKEEKYREILYVEEKYKGLYLEGNQYLIASNKSEVLIIDTISEENGVDESISRVNFSITDFIVLVENKQLVLKWIERNNCSKN